jgi:small GTP-binding protein
MSKSEYSFKICVVGGGDVGKTSLLKRLKSDEFSDTMQSTLGCEYFNMEFNYNGIPINVQLWDSSGQKKFIPIIPQIFKGMHGVMLVYDITNQKSFELLSQYINVMKTSGNANSVAMLIGNKVDKVVNREISTEKATLFAEQNSIR